MNLLIKEGQFSETVSQFFVAEILLGLEYVHAKGFIHRDLKPDNIMLDHTGHIKLTDFGLCTGFRWTHDSKYYKAAENISQTVFPMSNGWKRSENFESASSNVEDKRIKFKERRRDYQATRRRVAKSLVGTPNYISPEVLSMEGHTKCCDFWSLGVILFEMVCGFPPFHDNSAYQTQVKIMNFRKSFSFPSYVHLHETTKDFMRRLICEQKTRMGSVMGAEEIKEHVWIRDMHWNIHNMKDRKPPFVPLQKDELREKFSNIDVPAKGPESINQLLELQRHRQSVHPIPDQPNLGAPTNPNQGHAPASDLANMKLTDQSGDKHKLGGFPGSHAFLEFTFKRKCNSELESQTPFILKYDYNEGKMVADLPANLNHHDNRDRSDLITKKILQCMKSDNYSDTDLPMPNPPAYPDDECVKIGAMDDDKKSRIEEQMSYPHHYNNSASGNNQQQNYNSSSQQQNYNGMRVVDEEVYF